MKCDTCIVQLGKIGDILSVLPIAFNEYQLTGRKPSFMVAKAYERILASVDYVRPAVFKGKFFELEEAIKLARNAFTNVVVTQVYSGNFNFQKLTPSFQHDQWLRAGAKVDQFHESSLVINRRDKVRESRLLESAGAKGDYAVLADHSESSPFWEKEELASLVSDTLKVKLIRMSEVRAESFCDQIAILENAQAIVAVESAHLHLARACSVPTIAIVTDKPTRWHGTAWHPRYGLHIRYSQFDLRKGEIERCLLGHRGKMPKTYPTHHPYGYNPSILKIGDRTISTYRFHPEKNWKTRIAISDGENTRVLRFPATLDGCSFEDARLFTYGKSPWVSYVAAREEYGLWKSVIGYGPLEQSGDEWRVGEHIQIRHGKNDWTDLEKNWCFFEWERQLHAIYKSDSEQEIIHVSGNHVERVYKSKCLKWEYGAARGGVVLPYKDKLIRFFHSHSGDTNRAAWCYCIGAALMESKPPFKMVAMSKYPILVADEQWVQGCRHWKHNIAFICGAIEDGDGWTLTLGKNDCQCQTLKVDIGDLNL